MRSGMIESAELRANAGLDNLRLLLPMLTPTSELHEARMLIERARAGLEEDRQPVSLPPVGIMTVRSGIWKERTTFVGLRMPIPTGLPISPVAAL
jgi:signal transduction protein with GAF and PtsI domain